MLFSIVIIIACGIAFKRLFEVIKIPGLLGLILGGILLGPYGGNLLDPGFMEFSTEIRLLALIIILLRAGLGLNLEVLRRIGMTALKMSLLPCLLEGFTVFLLAFCLFGFPLTEAGILAFIIAAVSPALIVPSMLELRDKGLGMRKNIPLLVLAGASLDNAIAITVFSIFWGMAVSSPHSIFLDIGLIPLKIIGGVVLGILIGLLLLHIYKRARLNKTEELSFLVSGSIIACKLGELASLAGMLSIMAIGVLVSEKGSHHRASIFSSNMNEIWLVAELFLFILIGAAVNIQVVWNSLGPGLLVVTYGLLARIAGVLLATARTNLSLREKLFCAVAFLPKATVQAAIGGLPLAMEMPRGEIILAIAVLSILVTTPLGAVGIRMAAPKLLAEPREIPAAGEEGVTDKSKKLILLGKEGKRMLAKEIMTANVKVIFQESPLKEALKIMLKENISGLPVIDEKGRMVGVISESDIIRLRRKTYLPVYLQQLESFYFETHPVDFEKEVRQALEMPVKEQMSREVISVQENTPLWEVMRLMAENKINRIPVLREKKVVGIITRTDVINWINRLFEIINAGSDFENEGHRGAKML